LRGCAARQVQTGGVERRQHLRAEYLGQRLLVEQIATGALATGEITLKPRSTPAALDRLFKLIEEAPLPDDFLAESARMNLSPTPPTFGSTSGPRERSTKPRKTAKPRA